VSDTGDFKEAAKDYATAAGAASPIEKETLAMGCSRGGVYPRPQTTAITATGGDKPPVQATTLFRGVMFHTSTASGRQRPV
jgi:hypothetical protein